ncbi:M48 family metallopeptidase [Spongiibacter marinus]|uniref:M48 family metallopeptidase n=1 Tax=Spongiibacter marinus TaxID=354246 RepID=UPI003C481A9C
MTPPATEQGQLELEGLSVRYVVRRQSQRRRRLALRVSPSGDVEVRVPQHTPQHEIDAMLRRHGRWLRSCIEQAVPAAPAPQYRCGDYFSYLGERWQLRVEPGRGTSIFPEQRLLVIKARDRSPENIRRLFLCWLRDRSRDYFAARLAQLSASLPWPQPLPPLRVRAMRSRWGSCSRRGICLNTRLMKAPPLCIDMVIVHELCHIREMNHSSAFYALMDAAMPGWREASRQLDALSDQLLVD